MFLVVSKIILIARFCILSMVRLTEWIWKLIPQTKWCISKWTIWYFRCVRDGWRARKSDNKWGAGTARRLKRDKVVKIARLSSCKNFVSNRWLNIVRHGGAGKAAYARTCVTMAIREVSDSHVNVLSFAVCHQHQIFTSFSRSRYYIHVVWCRIR